MTTINKYHNAKIYTIRSPHTNLFYIGSTIKQLNNRLSQHKNLYNTTTSKIIIDYGNAYIELLENFKCENEKELNKREGELIQLHKNDIVNHRVAGRTKQEYNKNYFQLNKIKINERQKQNSNQKINCSICNLELNKHSIYKHNKRKHTISEI
jgi:hypothetical protein